MRKSGAEYLRNAPWLLRMDPFTKDGKIRAPNGVREYIQGKNETVETPTRIIVYEAPKVDATSSS